MINTELDLTLVALLIKIIIASTDF